MKVTPRPPGSPARRRGLRVRRGSRSRPDHDPPALRRRLGPRVFPEPGFDITAEDRPRHFGFGGGWHHCIGHFVARGDMAEALPLLAARLRDPIRTREVRSLPAAAATQARSSCRSPRASVKLEATPASVRCHHPGR